MRASAISASSSPPRSRVASTMRSPTRCGRSRPCRRAFTRWSSSRARTAFISSSRRAPSTTSCSLDDGRKDEEMFAAVAKLSELGAQAYETLVRPFVRRMVNEQSAKRFFRTRPLRVERIAFSDENPLMAPVKTLAEKARASRANRGRRQPVPGGRKAHGRAHRAKLEPVPRPARRHAGSGVPRRLRLAADADDRGARA